MENTTNTKYDEAVKHVKKIRGFHRHVLVYVIINIIIFFIKRDLILPLLSEKHIDDPGFFNWTSVEIIGTPLLWGIGLLIHGLYVYRHKFSFFKGWEERKIKELMEEDEVSESNKWE